MVYRGPISNNFDGNRFYNQHHFKKTLKSLLKWRFTRKPPVWPKKVELPVFPPPKQRITERDKLVVTYINHATVLVQMAGLNILTDPIWSERCSPFSWLGPKRVHEPGVKFEELPPIDLILLSHNHYDHMDLATLEKLYKRFNMPIYTGLGNGETLKSLSTIEMDWWQTESVGSDIQITFVPAQHWSGRTLWDSNTTLWGGFVISGLQKNIYFAGDTGYADHFKQIQAQFSHIDLALLPIGAYEARWFMQNVHINPEEAVLAHLDLNAQNSLGIHFNTFSNLADEAYDQAIHDLDQALTKHNISAAKFRTLLPGEAWEISS